MQEPLQNWIPSFAAVWRLLETEQKHAVSAAALSFCLILFGVGSAFAQQGGTVRGTVTDATAGDPLPGANIVLVGTQKGAATDSDGSYAIKGVEPGTYSVRASFLGYQETVRENVQVNAGETTTVNFSLQQQQQSLDELVVVGYGEQERQSVTAAVSQVSSEDLEDVQSTSIDQALQGQASGVNVTNTGSPGEGAIVRIRGLATTNNNNPLYVVDGVPTGGIEGLNPDDIQSIEVLKDASAASVYGSRAANGVVLITTKKGTEGDTRVSFRSSIGMQSVPESKWIDVMDTQQYVEFNRTLAQNSGAAPPGEIQEGNAEDILDKNVDWQDAVFQTGLVTNNSISVSGGSDVAQYRVSGGYTREEGAVVETGFERYSLRINSNIDLGRFDVSESFSVTHRIQNPMRSSEILGLAQRYPPYISVRNSDKPGGFDGPDGNDGFDDPNPVRIQELGYEETGATKLVGNLTVGADVVEGLTFETVLGLDGEFSTYDDFIPSFVTGAGINEQGYSTITENRSSVISPLSTTTLNLDQTFGSHNLNAVAGYEVNVTWFSDLEGQGRNPLTDEIEVPGSVQEDNVGGTAGTDVLQSVFGRVTYDYEGRYLLQGSIRRDGYSRFGPNEKYGIFPAGSVGWVLSEEPFLSDVSTLSNLKIRGSYGITGNNQSLDRYEYQSTVNTSFEYPFVGGNEQGASIVGLSNPDLRWETTATLNAGVDVGLFDQSFTFSGEYYRNTTEDILLTISLPPSFGFAGDPRSNTGTVQTSGFEFTAGYQSQGEGEFDWSVDANFSTTNNEVTSLGGGNPLPGADFQQAEGQATRIEEGEPIWFFYGWEVDRLYRESDFQDDGSLNEDLPDQAGPDNDPQPGDIKFVNQNGDDEINADDRTRIGSPHPDYYFGLSGNVSWNNFDFGLSLQGAAGHQIYRDYAYWTEGMTRINNHSTKLEDAWTPDNTDTNIPRIVNGSSDPNNNNRMSTRWISDADYLRVQRVTLGYELPLNLSQVRRARIYVQAKNLYTFTGYPGYDPEVGPRDTSNPNEQGADNSIGIDTGQYVQPRAFRVGVNLDF